MHIIHQVPRPRTLRRILKQAVFGSRVRCPECGSIRIRSIKAEERWRCTQCRKPFSIKSCCWLKGSKLSLETIWLLLWCWQKKFSLQNTQALVGCSYPTVSTWYQKFRTHIPREKVDMLLQGDIACDEAYTKQCSILGAKQKGTRNIVLRVLHKRSVDRHDAVDFLQRFVKANSRLCTDGAAIYKGIGNWHKVQHAYEIHKRFEFTLTAEIEGVWGVFRTFVRRMYHHVTKYKLEDMVMEFCLRFRQDEIFNSPQQYWRICLKGEPFGL